MATLTAAPPVAMGQGLEGGAVVDAEVEADIDEDVEAPPLEDEPLQIPEDEREAPPVEDEPPVFSDDEREAPPVDDGPLVIPEDEREPPPVDEPLLILDGEGGRTRPSGTHPCAPSSSGKTVESRGQWYGWQIFIADSLLHVTLLVGLKSGSDAAGLIGLGGGFVAGPLIHLAQGYPVRAAGSFALLIAPLALGIAVERGSFDSRTVQLVAVGTLLAEIVDIGVLAWQRDAPEPSGAKASSDERGAWGLWLQPTSAGGALLGIGGRL